MQEEYLKLPRGKSYKIMKAKGGSMRTLVKENPSLQYTAALQELDAMKQSLVRKKFTAEIDDLITLFWEEIPTTDLLQTINSTFDKDFSETTLRRRYNTVLKQELSYIGALTKGETLD